MNEGYIIEHATKGILMELPGERDKNPHFAWSKPRSEGKFFETRASAEMWLPLLPHGCYILRRKGWSKTS